MMKGHGLAVALLLLASCDKSRASPDTEATGAGNDSTNSVAASEIEQLRAQVSGLKRELAAAKRRMKPLSANKIANREPQKRRASMCYKDYCPCDPPQEGMDSIICDQLESGIQVARETMIAGRGGREYRRQAAAIGF